MKLEKTLNEYFTDHKVQVIDTDDKSSVKIFIDDKDSNISFAKMTDSVIPNFIEVEKMFVDALKIEIQKYLDAKESK